MSKGMGKKFESIVYEAFKAVPDVSIDRIPDQTMHYKGRANVSDFIVFRQPYQFYVECKTVHGNTLPLSNITQFDDLYEKSKIIGVKAGVLCWWIDKDVTAWIPIESLFVAKSSGEKSVRYDHWSVRYIRGRKKKVYFDYDMYSFFLLF